ncbi:MAG: hypothetical protein V1845_02335 [bacterium]
MKKVQYWFGGEVILGNWKSLWHFRPGDIIRSEYDPSEIVKMKGRRLVVEGFRRSSSRLFFIWARPIERKRGFNLHTRTGLILLARPGMKFKVGDKVRSAGIPEMTGKVIVICPEKRRRLSYLVAYDNANTDYGASDQYAKPWFPGERKDPIHSKNREWCSEQMLVAV